jgi:hypothetical protein
MFPKSSLPRESYCVHAFIQAYKIVTIDIEPALSRAQSSSLSIAVGNPSYPISVGFLFFFRVQARRV